MDGASGTIYHEITQRNARGQVTEERRADNPNLMTTRIYENATGFLSNIITPNLQNLAYGYDALGNVTERIDASLGSDIHEEFTYDGLQRLTGTRYLNPNGTTRTTVGYSYDALGNRTPGVGTATYGTKASYCSASGERTPGSGALSVLNGTQYCYDGRGNRVRSIASNGQEQQRVTYTAYGQAREVKSTAAGTQGHVTRYYYGPERQRIRRMDYYSASAIGSADVADEIGNAEIITRLGSSTRELRRSLGPVILSRMINSGGVVIGSNDRFLFTDAQGSPHRITAADGTLMANEGARWFTAFGARADTGDGDELTLIQVLNTATDQITRMSYTGHEAADAVGLIHMNGRMHDPIAGRFLQADPLVQDPSYPQNFNRYIYVFNNPLAWTDPTGHWGAREQGALRTVAAIVIAIYTGYYVNTATTLTTAQAAAITVAGGAASGALQTGTLRGALVGAFSAYVGYQIGNAYIGQEGSFGHVVAHATLGGVTSTLNGGKFGHGFIAAGFSTSLSPAINTGNDFGDGFLHALVGGTASRLSGGKLANGAVTAAFSFAVGRVVRRQTDEMATYSDATNLRPSNNRANYDPFNDLSVREKASLALDVVRETCAACDVPNDFDIKDLGQYKFGSTQVWSRKITFDDEIFIFKFPQAHEFALNTAFHETMHRASNYLSRWSAAMGDAAGIITPAHQQIFDRAAEMSVKYGDLYLRKIYEYRMTQ